MKIRKSMVMLATVAAAMAPLLASPGIASARIVHDATARNVSGSPDFQRCNHVYYHGDAGMACFERYGDKFWVKDNLADGHHVATAAEVNGTDYFVCHDYSGKVAGWTVCDGFSSQIPEHVRMIWNVSVMEGDTELAHGTMLGDETT